MFEIYTDGAFSRGGRGGWAYIVVEDNDGIIMQASGVKLGTTSQRMELTAAIEALKFCKAIELFSPTIISDSAYLVNCFHDAWWTEWRCSGNGSGKAVKNEDLWEELLTLSFAQEAKYVHVKGHNGNHFNELADDLAVEAKSLMKMRS